MPQINLFDERIYNEEPNVVPVKPWDCVGWHSDDPMFSKLLFEQDAKLVIEVGSWKGASAIHMAQCKDDVKIICVDTWLGGVDHLLSDRAEDQIPRICGGATLYWQFIQNVKKAKLTKRITPLQATSQAAALYLKALNITSELTYVDGSHQCEDVLADCRAYWPLTKGVMFGDDYGWESVRKAVQAFMAEQHMEKEPANDGNFWLIRR